MEITNLAKALVAAQKEMSGAKKDSTNPHFKSKYADLASVDAAIGPAAAKHGLGYFQRVVERDNAAAVETVILHESGEMLECGVVAVPVSKSDAQGYGSAMTYARRYSLSAAFGVCPEDDDGNAAAKAAPKPVASISPNDVGKEFWARAAADGDEEINYLAGLRDSIRGLLKREQGEAAATEFYAIKDIEEASAVWSQFDSKERSAIKAYKPVAKAA